MKEKSEKRKEEKQEKKEEKKDLKMQDKKESKAKLTNAIDDIFSKKTANPTQNASIASIKEDEAEDDDEESDIEYTPEQSLQAMHLLSQTKQNRPLPLILSATTLIGNLAKPPTRNRKAGKEKEQRTEDGLRIYNVNDICTTGGDSELCPFDCSCCF